MKINIIIIALLLFFICGCQVKSESVTLDLPEAPELKMRLIEWKVINDDKNTYMCLTPEYYSNLSLNTQDLKLFIIYQNKVIKIYKYND